LPGTKGGLYAWKQVRSCPEVILVEGLFDYAVLWQAGFHNVTCSIGSHLNAYQFRQLCDGKRTVYLTFVASVYRILNSDIWVYNTNRRLAMFSLLAVLVYLLAIGLPVYLLYHFHSQAWYWHWLAMMGALGIGLIPTPPEWKKAGLDLVFGFGIVFLLVWGIGGFVLWRSHREKRA
jgi:hypothetical protein